MTVSFFFAIKGPIETPMVGASILITSTVIGEPSLHSENFSDSASSVICLIPKSILSFFISGASTEVLTSVTL